MLLANVLVEPMSVHLSDAYVFGSCHFVGLHLLCDFRFIDYAFACRCGICWLTGSVEHDGVLAPLHMIASFTASIVFVNLR